MDQNPQLYICMWEPMKKLGTMVWPLASIISTLEVLQNIVVGADHPDDAVQSMVEPSNGLFPHTPSRDGLQFSW